MKQLLTIVLLFLSLAGYAQGRTSVPAQKQGSQVVRFALRGVVTYYFNENYGDKPDVGAVAYFVDEATANRLGVDWSAIYQYLEAYAAHQIPFEKQTPEEHEIGMNLYGRDDKAAPELHKIKEAEGIKQATVDGSGVYQTTLPKGAYRVVVLSGHRKHETKTEQRGQVRVIKIDLDEDKETSTRFDL